MAEKQYDLLFKLLLTGDSGVGKTCILHRFSDDTFNSAFISSIGVDYKIKTIELKGKNIKLQIWDHPNEKHFYSLSCYYTGAMGVMLVYDITNAESFENISRLLRQIEVVYERLGHDFKHENVVKMLLGNKCDMTDRRVISKELGEKIANDHQMRFLETSAKSNINIDKAFYDLVEAILDKMSSQASTSRMSIPPVEQESNKPAGGCC